MYVAPEVRHRQLACCKGNIHHMFLFSATDDIANALFVNPCSPAAPAHYQCKHVCVT
jgi:hypothetical protein